MLHVMTGDQADRAIEKIRAVYARIGSETLGETNRVNAQIEEIDKALWWLVENGYWFDIEAWLADETDFHFIHDYAGILRHVEPFTGELMDCFLPRYARAAE